MRRLAALAVLAAVTLAACTSGTGSADEGAGRCAAGPVALWSSQEASPSQAVVVGRSGPVATRTIDAMGLDVRPGEFSIGDHRYLLASGDTSHATTVLVDWRASSCTVARIPTRQPQPIATPRPTASGPSRPIAAPSPCASLIARGAAGPW